jgi:hypothetical protein
MLWFQLRNYVFCSKWIELVVIILSEISQAQKDNFTHFCLYAESRTKKKGMFLREDCLGGAPASGRRGKGESNGEVNLIKVHYMHVVNITIKPLCTINLCQ